VAAAGGYKLLMSEPPSVRKMLIARSMPDILPQVVIEKAWA